MKAKKSTLFCVVVAVIVTSLLAYRFTRSDAGRIATRRNDSGSVLDIELKTSNDSRYVADAGTTVPRRNDSRYVVDIELKKGNNSKYVVDTEQKKSEKHPEFFPSKNVIVRALYYDDRQRDGHQDAVVFLVIAWKPITDNKWITGCQVGDHSAKNYRVNLIGETPKWRAYPYHNKINHEEVLVDCFDVPDVRNGINGCLFYKTSLNGETERAVSERPLVIPAPHLPPKSSESSKYNFTVLTCTKIFDHPPWLQEWLEYQRTIGVDHVHMNIDDSFIRNSSSEDLKYLAKLIVEGFLSVDVWVLWLQNDKEIYYHNQGLILEDCVYRFRTSYDHVFILDTDDFFTPRVPGEPKIHYYLRKYCRGRHTGSCKFRWIEYYPDHYHLRDTPTVGGNVTDRLLNFAHYVQPNKKSVHRPNAVLDSATHEAHKMMKDYRSLDVPPSIAYVAHIRKGKHPIHPV